MWLPTFAEDHWVLRPEVLEELCEKDPGKHNDMSSAGMLEALTLVHESRRATDPHPEQPIEPHRLCVSRRRGGYRRASSATEVFSYHY